MSKELKLEIVERLLRRGEIPSAVVMSYEWRISKKKFQELCKKTGVVDGI